MSRGQKRGRASAAGRPHGQATRSPGARWGYWTWLLLLVAAALVHTGGLGAPLTFDDTALATNPYLTRLWPIADALRAPVQSSFAGRPLVSLSLAISYAMGDGLSPTAFRLWNVAVLLASALLLFGIVRRTLRRLDTESPAATGMTASEQELVACAVGLLWLVHPLQSEVVGYITQRTESMMGLCYFATLYAAIRSMERDDTAVRWTAVAVAACALGMAAKESMVTAPVMVLLYDRVFGARAFGAALARRRALYGGLAATWLLLAGLNLTTPRFRSAGFTAGVSVGTYLLNQAVMIVTYLKLALWPHPLLIDYGTTQPIAFTTALPYALIVATLIGLTVFAWRRHRVLAFLGSWFFITLAPSSSLVPIATEVGAERRMHLPLAAVIVLLLVGIRAVARRWAPVHPLTMRAGAAALALTALTWGALTAARVRAYEDPIGLWQQVLDVKPHGRAHYNLAVHLKEAGRTSEAIEHYRAALPDAPAAHYALGFEYGEAGRSDDAARELRAFMQALPEDALAPKASFLLGKALVSLGRTADAEQAFRDSLRMMPAGADARVGLADLLLATQRFADAASQYREYLQVIPGNAGAHHNLGMALLSTGQESEAVPEFERAVAINPSDPNLRLSLGQALASSGRLEEAVTHFRAGLRLAPSHPRMMSALALTLAAGGEVNEPLDLFRRARQLAPDDAAVQSDYDAAVARWRGGH